MYAYRLNKIRSSIDFPINNYKQLTENSDTCDPVDRINVALYPHQKTIVAALLKLEDSRCLKLEPPQPNVYMWNCTHLETNSALISERVGSGKTFMILATIALRPLPKYYPHFSNGITMNMPTLRVGKRTMAGSIARAHSRSKLAEHHVDFSAPRVITMTPRVIKPNIILVGRSVLLQWEDTIQRYTNFKYFVVHNKYSVNELQKMIKNQSINMYDIVLVKNGKAMPLNVSETIAPVKINSENIMLQIIAISRGYIWSRAFYDDFDTINIDYRTPMLPAIFSVFITATERRSIYKTTKIGGGLYENFEKIKEARLHDVMDDVILKQHFNIYNEHNFVENSLKITKINAFTYTYTNPNDTMIGLIGKIGGHEVVEIVEMLNGDAIATAADKIGIKSSTVADIFERILGNSYITYITSGIVMDRLHEYTTCISKLLHQSEYKELHGDDLDDEHPAKLIGKNITKIKHELINWWNSKNLPSNVTVNEEQIVTPEGKTRKRIILNIVDNQATTSTIVQHVVQQIGDYYFQIITKRASNKKDFLEYQNVPLLNMLEEQTAEFTEKHVTSGHAIQRVKDNLKEGECQVCNISFKDSTSGVNIEKKCGIAVCGDCLKGSFHLHATVETKKDEAVTYITGVCPNCRMNINLLTDIIYVDGESNGLLKKITRADVDSVVKDTVKTKKKQVVETAPTVVADPVELTENEKIVKHMLLKKTNPKLVALFQIINNMVPENRKFIGEPKIASLVMGMRDAPVPENIAEIDPTYRRKIIVFANYAESIIKIEEFFKQMDILYHKLAGSAAEMFQIVATFRSDNYPVLLVNSSQNCAGLNIQFASDIVYFHRIVDASVESQVAGRAQRIGRRFNLTIHNLLFNNEMH